MLSKYLLACETRLEPRQRAWTLPTGPIGSYHQPIGQEHGFWKVNSILKVQVDASVLYESECSQSSKVISLWF